ncbi:MAG: PAS domain-containing sensor histidine kinase [Candidatus Brocadia sp. WS118]|nr:MAG: PAS domain-containing sensor histidine kinase [Candidatus Brocadia sp. WS118]
MFKNKLFWKIFISYIGLLCLCLALTGYFVSRVLRAYYLNPLTRTLESDMKIIIGYMLLTFAITLIIGFILIRINTSSFINITQIAKNFARGNFARKAEIASSDEMGDLAHAINVMGVELQSRMQTILDDKNKLDAIMANMNDAVIATDLQERIILINNAAKTMFDISAVVLNKNYLWEKIRNEKLRNLVRETIKTQTVRTSEIEIPAPGKKLLHIHLAPLQVEKNSQGVLLVFHDITELRKLENARREFVANVSHELRTPLASIKGYVETLLENNSLRQEDTQEFLHIILKHSQRLDNLIKDILELSRLDSHDLKTELAMTDILLCVENISAQYQEHCGRKNQTLDLDIPHQIPLIETNEYLFRQLLTNLLDNAIKYTASGGRICLKVEPTNKSIRFEISDTGIGIPQEHIPRIFERFYRVDPARSREMGGTGLGLSIVKHIVLLHHGHIQVESTVNVGTKFIITIPQQQTKYTA